MLHGFGKLQHCILTYVYLTPQLVLRYQRRVVSGEAYEQIYIFSRRFDGYGHSLCKDIVERASVLLHHIGNLKESKAEQRGIRYKNKNKQTSATKPAVKKCLNY